MYIVSLRAPTVALTRLTGIERQTTETLAENLNG
jgi:hypothetical protein